MPLDPEMQRVLDGMPEHALAALEGLPVAEGIARMRSMAPIPSTIIDPAPRFEDRLIPGPHGNIPVRIYWPGQKGPYGLLIHFHGGGWVFGSVLQDDQRCHSLTNLAGCMIVSVDYRLAPEHKFPVALEEGYAVAEWVAENAVHIGADPARIAIGGASAGANIAIGVALMARDRDGPSFKFQLLVYPVCDGTLSSASYFTNGHDYYLRARDMEWFWRQYADEADRRDPYASPLLAPDLSGLPPALVMTAEFDPLRDEGEDFAARLQEAGVTAWTTRYKGVVHGFLSFAPDLQQSREAMAECAVVLREEIGWGDEA